MVLLFLPFVSLKSFEVKHILVKKKKNSLLENWLSQTSETLNQNITSVSQEIQMTVVSSSLCFELEEKVELPEHYWVPVCRKEGSAMEKEGCSRKLPKAGILLTVLC